MDSEQGRRIYEELGVKPLINAVGNQTLLGGSRVTPKVQAAMTVANRYFVEMEELLLRSGEFIARSLGAEAALVTSGCAAAISIGVAACISGSDKEKIERMPDTTGMKNEILLHKAQRYKYDRCLTIFGGKMVEVGDERGASAAQLAAAITDKTAAIHYLAVGSTPGIPTLQEVIRIGKQHHVPVVVDAASQIFPIETFKSYAAMGADLVCFGAKYFGSYNSTGILCGRKDLMDAAFLHCFIGFESRAIRSMGRPLKVDRQEVIGTVVALREWLSMDHSARLAEHARKVAVIRQALEGVPHVTLAPLTDERSLGTGLILTVDEKALGKTVPQIVAELRGGNPGICVRGGEGSFWVTVPNLIDGEEEIVARRLREVLKR